MFKPEKLARINIQVPEKHISDATAALVRFRLLHLIRIRETRHQRLDYVAPTDKDLFNEIESLIKRIDRLLEALRARPVSEAVEEIKAPEETLTQARERFESIQGEIEPTLEGLRSTDTELRELNSRRDKFRLLPDDLDFSRLSSLSFVNWMIGLVPTRGLEKLAESLSEVNHAFIDIGSIEQRAVILVFGLKEDWPVFERALRGAFFEKVDISAQDSGLAGEITEQLQSRIDTLEEKRNELTDRREAFKKSCAPELSVLREKVIAARQMVTARQFFEITPKGYIISGWIPARRCDDLENELRRVTGGDFRFEKVDPDDVLEVREGIIRIPILLNNPMLISPFQKLTGLYGTPRYSEIDPTPFFAVSFLLMFGMMFGDIGHGLAILALGYLIFRRFYKYLEYGVILMECGVSSIIFGFLYGSLFGLEHIVPPLWFNPLRNISYIVTVALITGVGLVSLGFVLNLINALRSKDYEQLLSATGLAGALLYWIVAGLGFKYFLTGALAPIEIIICGYIAAGLIVIIILHQPMYRIFIKREKPLAVLRARGLANEIVESIVEFFDDLLAYLANTVSFIRVAAFALAHAALFVAVFSVADIVAHDKGGGALYWLVIIFGNIATILLEGLVVSIQVMRLEYYEFFNKFFKGGGEEFKTFDRATGAGERSS